MKERAISTNQPGIPLTVTAVRIRQLQLFTLLAEVGSVSEAARRLHVTQPTATEMLKELERAFAVQLFDRGPRGVSLTVQGERMASRVAIILRELQRAVAEGRSAGMRGRSLKVGFVPTLIYSGLRSAFALLLNSHPDIQLQLHALNVPDCAQALREGAIDVAITLNHPTFTDETKGEPISTTPLIDGHVGVFASHLLKPRPRRQVTLEGLREMPWMLPGAESFSRRVFEDVFFQHGLAPPERVVEITPMTLAAELLRSMPYVALLPRKIMDMGDFGHLVPLAVEDFNFPARLVFACRESKLESAGVQQLLKCILDTAI
jgi:DNA-binding transcriptional LysR family regulator